MIKYIEKKINNLIYKFYRFIKHYTIDEFTQC